MHPFRDIWKFNLILFYDIQIMLLSHNFVSIYGLYLFEYQRNHYLDGIFKIIFDNPFAT